MKLIASIVLTALFSYLSCIWFPWWSIAVVAFIVAILVPQRSGRSFGSGFLALFLLWGISAYIIDFKNEQILSKKIAQILPLGGSSALLILITGLVGGLVAGMAAWSGSYVRKK